MQMMTSRSSVLCAAALALLGGQAFSQTTPVPGTTPPAETPPAATAPMTPATPAVPPATGATPATPAVPPATGATPPAGTDAAMPGADAAPVDCDAEFLRLDANTDGFISAEESPRDFARSRIDEVTVGEGGMSRDDYLTLCSSDEWSSLTPEEGAPFEGANSFTEEQARDRAMAWNVTDVSALEKDDKGIWRGTGKVNGADVSVAIDYKGNVVTDAKQ